MKRALLSMLFLVVGSLLRAESLADMPDPLVGTDSSFKLSHGNTYPAVFLPYGMSNWTPQTGEGGWTYQYSKNSIIGFLSTHRPSAWTVDWGSFSLMPEVGTLKVLPKERGAAFKHEDETARAYRYSVSFAESGIRTQMTPTRHGGVLQFAFPKTSDAHVVLDTVDGGSVRIYPETNTITGTNWHTADGTARNFAVYFVAVFDHKFASHGTWDISGAKDRADVRAGKHVGAYVGFSTEGNDAVTVRIGTSLISAEQAERNLQTEIGDASFEQMAEKARTEWERELKKVTVQGGTHEQQRTFYTALYHTFQFPRLLNETDKTGATVHYSPYDGKVHGGPMLSDVGFWDTFRAAFPLMTVLNPQRDSEMIQALVNIYDESGRMPKWADPVETNVMIATNADSVVADAYVKGIRGYDAEKAYAAIRKDGTDAGTGIFDGRLGLSEYLKLGYVPADTVGESAARTLEDAYDDACIAAMARALGKDEDYRAFTEHSKNYQNIFDKSVGFMRGKNLDGSWVEPFDPIAWGGVYTEGDAWQWLWSVQQDVPGLVKLLGGREAFIEKLDALFTTTSDFKVGGYHSVIHEMTEAKMGGTGQYAHINEPVHHVIYLYDYVGQPWKTQKWAHEVMNRFYKPGPAGWLGDEDNGQTSAWYVFTALGFYPVNPGQPIYAIGSPLFQRATIALEQNRTFTVEADGKGDSDIYIQSATLNGQALDRPWLSHSEIMAGGTLHLQLGSQPNQKWGAGGLPTASEKAK